MPRGAYHGWYWPGICQSEGRKKAKDLPGTKGDRRWDERMDDGGGTKARNGKRGRGMSEQGRQSSTWETEQIGIVRGRHRYGRDQARSEAQRQDQTWWLKGRQEGGGERRGTLLPHGVRYEWETDEPREKLQAVD